MPHKDPETARAYRKANSAKRYEAFKRWKASLSPEQLDELKARSRERRKENPEHHREIDRASKLRNRVSVLRRKREHHHKNRDRELERMRLYRTENIDKVKRDLADWYQQNRDYATKAAREYYHEHRDEIRGKIRDRNAKKFRPTLVCGHCGSHFVKRQRYQRFCNKRCSSRHSAQIHAANRKAAQVNADGVLTKQQWYELMCYFDWRCGYCGKRSPKRLTIDHVQPFSRKGSNDPLNLVPACKKCNCSKHDSNLIEFMFLRRMR